ncbi:MAG: hypothetical protein V2I43_26645 [Parvularcula sp.]|jgi:hypothetical protein|nr:hypothetical protein [Parvularcula sp.]
MTPEDLKRDCDLCRDKQNERFSSLEQRLTALEITLWGQTGNNGLRSDIRELKRKMDMLLRFFWVATAIPPIVVSILAVLKFLGRL